MDTFGFKQITASNIFNKDDVFPFSIEDWLEALRPVQLAPTVPLEIRRLFEVVKGIMAYGCLYYPLYTLAGEQVSRVAEAAVGEKCKSTRLATEKNFHDEINWLQQQGVLTPDEAARWHNLRKIRNRASHPEFQTLLPPGLMLGHLIETGEMIDRLFPPASGA